MGVWAYWGKTAFLQLYTTSVLARHEQTGHPISIDDISVLFISSSMMNSSSEKVYL